ncbi:carbohydrate binding domain-containing protein [Streptomyces alfalfae]|uniref:Carbohydrate binding domain-containing protein n=1 Tax=Streptomyces alfalfae TaxID=1642299 RepID=A0A7T4TY14_9ACTN|nr:carbohydrate binding domain-containing protein [Streptomyces alfalfae]QQC89824.1 carbohydrate binding domain-containing protein [Streptomyces alfalfae]
MTRLVVEVAFGSTMSTPNPAWTEITQYVDVAAGISIDRGASDELQEISAGTCSMTLDNSDGRFTAGLSTSPYFPHVRKNTPIRVRTLSTDRNLILNPDFESGFGSWGTTASPTAAMSTTRAYDGTQSARITWGAASGQSLYTMLFGLDIGVRYACSAYVWVAAGAPAMECHIDGMATGTASTLTGVWQRITYSFTATATQHLFVIQQVGTATAGTQCWVDAVQVEEGAAPTAYSPLGAAKLHPRFFGMVNDWPTKWKGLYSIAPIVCTDVFKMLSRQESLQPMLVEEVLLDNPTLYFPLGEPTGSTSAGNMTATAGVGTLTVVQAGLGGTLTFGDGQGPPGAGDMPAPTFTPDGISAGKYLTANLGQVVADMNDLWRVRWECWFTTSQDGRVLMALTSVRQDVRLIFSLEAGTGKVMIEYSTDRLPLQTTVAATPNLADGKLHHLHYHELFDELYVDGVLYGAVTAESTDLRIMYVGGYEGSRLWSGTISHLAVYLRTITSPEILTHYTTGITEHIGESAAARLARIASYVPVALTTQGTVFDGMGSQSSLGSSPLTHLKEIETTESGKLLADRASAGLLFQARDVRYNQTPPSGLTLAYGDLETDGVELADDDQKMINTVVASRPGGATQRVVNQTARDTYGPYEKPLDLLKSSDLKVLDAANWLVSRYADPPTEIRQVPINAYTMPLATYRALLAADVSTVIGLTGLPAQAPARRRPSPSRATPRSSPATSTC